MRELIVNNIVSLDGYFEGPGQDVMALPMGEAFDTGNVERLRAADTFLLGRTNEGFKGHWPSVADAVDADATNQEISRLIDAIGKRLFADDGARRPLRLVASEVTASGAILATYAPETA